MNEYEIGITFFGAGAAAMADHDIIFGWKLKLNSLNCFGNSIFINFISIFINPLNVLNVCIL